MIFDLFHSVSDPVVGGKQIGPRRVFDQFVRQVQLAESAGCDTAWLAESHFSSEVQKSCSVATIPHFYGEVGLNSDSFQWFHWLAARTKKISLGTGIHNIVGGSGGPIASADRVNALHFINRNYWNPVRNLRLGVASGRFPYQNTPFGIEPRTDCERDFWPIIRRVVFLEALEIFLRLLKGETLGSAALTRHEISEAEAQKTLGAQFEKIKTKYRFPVPIVPRWSFEPLKLIPANDCFEHLRIVLGSADPQALDVGLPHWDLDLFNLSFTPPEQIDQLHAKMGALAAKQQRNWMRSRLPRTVLVFIDPNPRKAEALAHFVLDTYVEAMRGTAAVPDKSVLLQRALVGDAVMVREQLHPDNPRRFHAEDRLMLWFEFNQLEGERVESQMKYFFDEVVGKL